MLAPVRFVPFKRINYKKTKDWFREIKREKGEKVRNFERKIK